MTEEPWDDAKLRQAATAWLKKDYEVDWVMSGLDPTHANNLLAGFRAGWHASIEQLFNDITEETGHLTLASLIGEWRSLKEK